VTICYLLWGHLALAPALLVYLPTHSIPAEFRTLLCLKRTTIADLQANKSAWEPWLANNPRQPSWDHRASGVYAALSMTGKLDLPFQEWYFNWLDDHADPRTGFVCAPDVEKGNVDHQAAQVAWMTCYAHLSWQYVHANKSWRV
jgi:hypothetical protein